MTPEQRKSPDWQLTSLEISKRLKELNVPQESLFYWQTEVSTFKPLFNGTTPKKERDTDYSAFTVAELGMLIPQDFLLPFHNTIDGKWMFEISHDDLRIDIDTEADARGKMLVYLLENKLIQL